MAKGDLKINTIQLPIETVKFTEGWIDFEVSERTVNRTLVSDFIAFKRKFSISWEYPITGTLLAQILELYLAKADVTFTIVNADLTETLYTCKVGISDSYLREIASGNYAYSGFTVDLEEV